MIIDASLMHLQSAANGVPPRGIVVDGIIGWDTIRQFDLTMNYSARKGHHPGAGFVISSMAGSRIFTGSASHLLEARTRSGDKYHFTLDTGAQSSFLNATVLEKIGASANPRRSSRGQSH